MKKKQRLSSFLNLCFVSFCLLFLLTANSCLYKKHSLQTKLEAINVLQPTHNYDSLATVLVQKMSLREKVSQITGEAQLSGLLKLGVNFMVFKRFPHMYSGKNKRLGIPPFSFSDGPRGATVGGHKNTIFPVAMARAATWNIDLEKKVAGVIATEIRANKGNYSGTPCINLLRHPAWGRAQETYGEDPYLLGEMGLAYTLGLQEHNVMACPKHFALNSIENARFYINIQTDERTLREVYLPHFKKVIQKGKAASLMSAYNRFRGNWCGENVHLLNTILREEWGFKGFVSSDWVWGLHHTAKGINAGMDIEMPVRTHYKYSKIKKALSNNQISTQTLDRNVHRILRTKLQFALTQNNQNYTKQNIAPPQHIKLAQRVAEESMVLLKNNNVLPFQIKKGEKIAVIGQFANIRNTGDHGSSGLRNKDVTTAFQGIQLFAQKHGALATLDKAQNLTKSIELAKKATKVVLVVGYNYKDEGEYLINKAKNETEALKKAHKKGKGGDRQSLELSQKDIELIQKIAPLNPNTVVVYVGGSAITLESWKNQVPAILFSWYSGMEGGHALANILFGVVNPSGKLPFVIPQKANDLPYFNRFADSIHYGYYHGYTLLDKENKKPSFPFGFGMSYTSFRFDKLSINKKVLNHSKNDSLTISVQLKNTGLVEGAEVCQLYIGFKNSKIDRPVKILRGFQKVWLKPNEQKELSFKIKVSDLTYYNTNESKWDLEKMDYEIYIGNSSSEYALLQANFTIK